MSEWWMQLADLDPMVGYGVIAASSVIEYIFSPFPGDTIVLLGCVLSHTAGWSLPAIVVAITGGNVLGSWLNYEAGAWLDRSPRQTWLHRKLQSPRIQKTLDKVYKNFEKYGTIYICLNRFLPGIRSFFFLAAGMANLPRWKVLSFGALSALTWSLLIAMIGSAIGFELDALVDVMRRYTQIVWILLVLAVTFILIRKLYQYRRARRQNISDLQNETSLPPPKNPTTLGTDEV